MAPPTDVTTVCTVNELLTKLFYISFPDDFMGDGCDVQDIHRSHVACG
jgi:hypothetical protein